MNNTIIVQIGNSDDKLTQSEWNSFVGSIKAIIEKYANEIHFFGAPPNYYQWQNAAWIFTARNEEKDIENLKAHVARIGKTFKQESIAWTEGRTYFI